MIGISSNIMRMNNPMITSQMLDMAPGGAYDLLYHGKREAPENEAMEAREEQVPQINI